MLTSEEKDQIAEREITITLKLGEAGAVGVAIAQMMRRIEDGTFVGMIPLNQMKLYLYGREFAERMQAAVESALSQEEREDMHNFQKTIMAKQETSQ